MTLKHVLLGIIRDEGPISGYDLSGIFRYVLHYFWSADRSRIYRTLHRLHDDGLVAIAVVEQDDNPDKKVYTLTDAGAAVLRDWLSHPLPPQPNREEWLAQLFFADEIGAESVIALLEARIARHEDALAELAQRESDTSSAIQVAADEDVALRTRLRVLTLDYGIAYYRFQIEWARRAIRALRGEAESPQK